jgi:transcriptional regulator ATRX
MQAHSMGLGKTLQAVAYLHTVLCSKLLPQLMTAVVVTPKNTLFNWSLEFRKWTRHSVGDGIVTTL